MSDHHRGPNVVLSGGDPALVLREDERFRYVPDPDVVKIKLPRGGRYEHFEASEQTTVHEGRELRVFVWTGCTYVAE
jgi:Family of unknown function (DUF5988)